MWVAMVKFVRSRCGDVTEFAEDDWICGTYEEVLDINSPNKTIAELIPMDGPDVMSIACQSDVIAVKDMRDNIFTTDGLF